MSNFRSNTLTQTHQISAGMFNFIIGIVLLYGFALNWYIVETIPVDSIKAINPWLFFGGYFVSCMVGVFLFNGSKNPLISFLGYNLVVVPFGLVVSLIVSDYSTAIVVKAMQATTMVTVGMMFVATIFPSFFKSIGSALFWALLISIVVELLMIFVFKQKLSVIDWIVALIFCGYIGFDWAMANSVERTFDNAVDSAAELYMDIINLFVRILSIMGKKN
jgi:FtsH-binding integral membrane protein